MQFRALENRYAYIPPQCYTKTRVGAEPARNPCYACHVRPQAPNYVDDAELQQAFDFPPLAAVNRWTNWFSPAAARGGRDSDEQLLAYVRQSNYFDGEQIALRSWLVPLTPAWDGERDGHWDGFVPDAHFRFDARGFDRDPRGAATGWRAFAYYPFLGTFFPTNGSMDDVLIRLAPAFRQATDGREDLTIYALNLAIVEALIKRADVAIERADERALGADLDLDGELSVATRVAFDRSGEGARMRYVGRAGALEAELPAPSPGLFPLGTEFLHSVRYLDLDAQGRVKMAARMKELRYAKKVRWFGPADLEAHAAKETVEQSESADGAHEILWEYDRGIYNGQGWLFQGFIEAADGRLRPQSYEETVYCAGCHGGVGATTDSTFSFARKLGAKARAGGWFHGTQAPDEALPDPVRSDGRREYTGYLEAAGAGDEFRENDEVMARFFDARGRLKPAEAARLRRDVRRLLVPSAARALALDHAYRAVVREQSFVRGRDAVLTPGRRVHERVEPGASTGVQERLDARL
jgi:hypothetical protein